MCVVVSAWTNGGRDDADVGVGVILVDPTCTQVGNAVLSCYPQANSRLVQNVWSKFIW